MKPLSKDTKKFIILGSLTGAAIIAAVISFAVYFANSNKKASGWYSVPTDERVVNYTSDISLYYYFKNDDNSQEFDTLRQYYTDALREAYINFDSLTTYEGFTNIASINKKIGEDIKVDELLYKTLKNAYELTLESNNFSIFEAPIKNFWNRILQLDNAYEESDPLNNVENQELLDTLVERTNDLSNFNLSFKEDNVINFSINDEYKSLLKENYLDSEIISLNDLQNPFVIDYVEGKLKKEGFTCGFLADLSGNFSGFENCPESTIKLFDSSNLLDSTNFGDLSISANCKISQLNRFNRDYEIIKKAYLLKKGESSYLRSSYINLVDGYDSGIKVFSVVQSIKKNLVEVNLENINSTSYKTNVEFQNYLDTLDGYNFIYRFTNESNIIRATNNIKNNITLVNPAYKIN